MCGGGLRAKWDITPGMGEALTNGYGCEDANSWPSNTKRVCLPSDTLESQLAYNYSRKTSNQVFEEEIAID